ncbi:MAG: TlpA disulfide reductase family protein [Nitrospirota bacterium]
MCQIVLAAECPLEGDVFPDILLPAPQNATEKNYLGIIEKDSFNLSQIKSKLIILEIFSMYCPYCQKEAPMVNELYQIINNTPDIKDTIKIIGIGAGNTAFEVDVFKNQYNVPFPLFPDESFTIHKIVGDVRTPYFFVFKLADGFNEIIYSKSGSIQDPHQFLDIIIKKGGIDE